MRKKSAFSAFAYCLATPRREDLNQRTHEKSQINERFIYDNKPPQPKVRLIIWRFGDVYNVGAHKKLGKSNCFSINYLACEQSRDKQFNKSNSRSFSANVCGL
jgi:hypothetical protein